jgi:hypothetical protein
VADVFTACSDFYLLFEKEREKMRDGGGGVLRADNESTFDRRKNKKRGQTSKQNCQQNA